MVKFPCANNEVMAFSAKIRKPILPAGSSINITNYRLKIVAYEYIGRYIFRFTANVNNFFYNFVGSWVSSLYKGINVGRNI